MSFGAPRSFIPRHRRKMQGAGKPAASSAGAQGAESAGQPKVFEAGTLKGCEPPRAKALKLHRRHSLKGVEGGETQAPIARLHGVRCTVQATSGITVARGTGGSNLRCPLRFLSEILPAAECTISLMHQAPLLGIGFCCRLFLPDQRETVTSQNCECK